VIVVAGALRLWRALVDGSNTWDEVFLAVNIFTRSPGELLHALDLQQVAPPLYLLTVKAIVTALGTSDLALRLLSLVLGTLTVAVVAGAADAAELPRGSTVTAALLAAASPALVTYSAMLKPYGTDAFVAALLLLGALRLMQRSDPTIGRWYITAGCAAILFSLPSIFILGGVACAVVVERVRAGKLAQWVDVALASGVWLALFGVVYVAFYRSVSMDPGMRWYWAGKYLRDVLANGGVLGGVNHTLTGLADSLLLLDDTASMADAYLRKLIIVPLGFAGALYLAHQRRFGVLVLLTVPMLGVIAASLLRQYILTPRLLLFLAPSLCLLVSAGLFGIVELLRRDAIRLMGGVVVAGAVVLMLRLDTYPIRHPESNAQAAALTQRILPAIDAGAVVYLPQMRLPLWMEYATDWSAPDTARIRAQLHAIRMLGMNAGNEPPRGRAVEREGDSLRFARGAGVELYGIPSGTGGPASGIRATTPDTGWAENEVRRIRETGKSHLWIMGDYRSVPKALFDRLQQGGGVLKSTIRVGLSQAWLYEFPPARVAEVRQAGTPSP
jgi:hypothetical protein